MAKKRIINHPHGLTRKKIQAFIQDEKAANATYKKYGLDALARDEHTHYLFLKKQLKKKTQSTKTAKSKQQSRKNTKKPKTPEDPHVWYEAAREQRARLGY